MAEGENIDPEEIRENLDYIQDKSKFEQSMGKEGMAIGFAPGVEEDFVKIFSESPEETARKAQELHDNLISEIKKMIKEKNEVVFVSDGKVLDHYLTDNELNINAYYLDHQHGKSEDLEKFCKERLPDLIKGGFILNSDVLIVIPDENSEHRVYTVEAFYVKTKNLLIYDATRDAKATVNTCNDQLIGERGINAMFFTKEQRERDVTWKKELWQNELVYPENLQPDLNPAYVKTAAEYLHELRRKLDTMQFTYQDIEEWRLDVEFLDNFLEDYKKDSSDYLTNIPDRMTRSKVLYQPSRMNSITVQDLATHLRNWIKKYTGITNDFKLVYGTRFHEAIHHDFLVKKVSERLTDFEYKGIQQIVDAITEFQEKHNLNCLPYGKTF